jgi:hypothetical protein
VSDETEYPPEWIGRKPPEPAADPSDPLERLRSGHVTSGCPNNTDLGQPDADAYPSHWLRGR